MINRFADVMSRRTDQQLIEMVGIDRDTYEPEALAAAEAEIERRQLSFERVEEVREQIQLEDEERQRRASMKLDDGWKFLAFIFPGLINLLLAGTLKVDGYHRKSKVASTWIGYGCLFYIGLMVLMELLNAVF